MAAQFVHHDHHNARTARAPASGSVLESIAAAAAIVVTIIGLAGAAPVFLAAVATIVIGAALLIEGGGVASRHHLLAQHEADAGAPTTPPVEELGRTSAESIAGITGIVLGILSVITLAPRMLLPVSLIVFGGGLIIGRGSASTGGLHGSGHVFVGVGAVVLGILSLVGIEPLTLVLVGLLAIGVAFLFSSTTWGARIMQPGLRHPAR